MQNKLQELTEKIYNEGLTKGTEEANQLVNKAKEDASKIIADAKKHAEQIIAQSKKEAADLKKNVETEIGISARQVVSALKQDISKLIETKIIQSPITDALKDTEFIKKMIEIALKNWNPNSTDQVNLKVLIPAEKEKELKDYLSKKVMTTLNQNFEVVADKNLKYGFKIGPQDGSFFISFSDLDFENLFREYMRPRIIEMLFGGK